MKKKIFFLFAPLLLALPFALSSGRTTQPKSAQNQALKELGEFTDSRSGDILELLGDAVNNTPEEVQGFACQCDAIPASGTYTAGYWYMGVYHDPTCGISFAGTPNGWGVGYHGSLVFY